MAILLTRHADALSRSRWHDDDALRPLTERGEEQARRLVDVLAGFAPVRICSSPARRCLDTVAPLAQATGVAVEPHWALAEGACDDALALLRDAAAWGNVVLCTHGDVIPVLLQWLDSKCGLGIGPDERYQKGSVWVLGTADGDVVSARYEPPRA